MFPVQKPCKEPCGKAVWVNECGTKSQENGHQRAFLPKIYATSTVRCPIRFYKLFQDHWPKEMRQPDSPFFFCCQTRQSSWKKQNMVHEITTRKKSNWAIPFCSSRQCRHSKNWSSNHSVSKTSISRLLDASTPQNFNEKVTKWLVPFNSRDERLKIQSSNSRYIYNKRLVLSHYSIKHGQT